MDERQFWDIVRRALLMVVHAIERRHRLGKVVDSEQQEAPTPRYLGS